MKKLSHRLTNILALARRRRIGLEVKLSHRQLTAIRQLDVTYASDQLRYIVTGATVVPTVQVLAEAAEAIVVGLERYCTGSRGHA